MGSLRPFLTRSSALCAALLLSLMFAHQARGQAQDWLQQIRVPPVINAQRKREPVVIAIVDDALDLSAPDLAPFAWINPEESLVNGRDDDGNGLVDDINGWDISDGDRDTSPPADREDDFSHGALLARIITRMARRAYGEAAPEAIRILAVKAAPDRADPIFVFDGFQGIAYASERGADIVLTSWGIPQMPLADRDILESAQRRGTLLVGAAGNIAQETKQFPAAHETTLSVSATETRDQFSPLTSWDQSVDLTAPGMNLWLADGPKRGDAQAVTGSSYSAAMVAGAAALVMAERPELSAAEVRACLIDAALPQEQVLADRFAGKFGAGRLDVAGALECQVLFGEQAMYLAKPASKGIIRLAKNARADRRWTIQPAGEFRGLRFRLLQEPDAKSRGTLRVGEGSGEAVKWVAEYALADIPESFFVPASEATVTLSGSRRLDSHALLEYEAETIDFSTRYCSGRIELSAPAVIEDGSAEDTYSAASSCQWLITAPEGQRVRFRFDEFDTQDRVDYLWFFDGDHTNRDVMARFSGSGIPPELTSWGRQVLVWFVTDGSIEGQGWRAQVEFVDPPPAPAQ